MKWVDGEQELADGLTKPWKHEPLIKALKKVIFDPEFQSARRKRALRISQQSCDAYWLHHVWQLDCDQKNFVAVRFEEIGQLITAQLRCRIQYRIKLIPFCGGNSTTLQPTKRCASTFCALFALVVI